MSQKKFDLSGQIFTRWTVQKQTESRSGKTYWLCRCECGTEKMIRSTALTSGDSKSCGCLRKELSISHGLRDHILYGTWTQMNARCYNPKAENYKYYGGRGITVCESWRHDPTEFIRWCEEESNWTLELKDKGYTLERNKNSLGYGPSNCTFETKFVQAQHRGTSVNNTSGRKGVNEIKGSNKWRARIRVDGKVVNLGYYTSFDEAAKTREKAEIKYFGRLVG